MKAFKSAVWLAAMVALVEIGIKLEMVIFMQQLLGPKLSMQYLSVGAALANGSQEIDGSVVVVAILAVVVPVAFGSVVVVVVVVVVLALGSTVVEVVDAFGSTVVVVVLAFGSTVVVVVVVEGCVVVVVVVEALGSGTVVVVVVVVSCYVSSLWPRLFVTPYARSSIDIFFKINFKYFIINKEMEN